jgi:hypothetical protein
MRKRVVGFFGSALIRTWLWISLSQVHARTLAFRLWGLRIRFFAALRWDLNKLSSMAVSTRHHRLPSRLFDLPMTTIPLPLRMGGGRRSCGSRVVRSLGLFWFVRCFQSLLGEADSSSLRSETYACMEGFVRRSTYARPIIRILADVRREFMHRLYVALHGTLGCYIITCWYDARGWCSSYCLTPSVGFGFLACFYCLLPRLRW